jgi:hypothetical protein
MIVPKIYRFLVSFILIVMLGVPTAQSQISKTVGLLKGVVTLADGTPVVDVPVTIFKGTEVLSTTKSSPEGKISTILQPNATYRLRVNSSNYMYHEDTLILGALKTYQEFPVHMILSPLRDGQAFELQSPVFAPKSQSILSCTLPAFDRIVDQMKHNPKLSVSITVYPDAPVKSKKDAAQKTLAAGRETSMRSYFLNKGITESRFSVQSEITSVPPGQFQPNDPSFPPAPAATPTSSKKKKKGHTPAPASTSLVPQFVAVIAHIAS